MLEILIEYVPIPMDILDPWCFQYEQKLMSYAQREIPFCVDCLDVDVVSWISTRGNDTSIKCCNCHLLWEWYSPLTYLEVCQTIIFKNRKNNSINHLQLKERRKRILVTNIFCAL